MSPPLGVAAAVCVRGCVWGPHPGHFRGESSDVHMYKTMILYVYIVRYIKDQGKKQKLNLCEHTHTQKKGLIIANGGGGAVLNHLIFKGNK